MTKKFITSCSSGTPKVPNNNFDISEAAWYLAKSTHSKIYITDDIPTRLSKEICIDLDYRFPDGTNLLDRNNQNWYGLVIQYIYLVRNSHGAEIKTAMVHKAVVLRLLTFLCWCRLQGFYTLKDIKEESTEQYVADILYGAGHALRYLERLKGYFEGRGSQEIPTLIDPTCKSRIMVDTSGILKELGIPITSLSGDVVASTYLKKRVIENGYRIPGYRESIPDVDPELKPIGRVNHKRYMTAIRNLFIWREQLGDESLNFLPCVSAFEAKNGWYSAGAARHTKNIPPAEAMKLLDSALLWVYDYAPKVLTIYDGMETIHRDLVRSENKFRAISSPKHIAEMHRAFKCYLADEDKRGVMPLQFSSQLSEISGINKTSCLEIFLGDFNDEKRVMAKKWLSLSGDVGDGELQRLFKLRAIASNKRWAQTWPYSIITAANLIGINEDAMRKFLASKHTGHKAGEIEVYEFLVEKGYLQPIAFTNLDDPINATSRLMDRTLEKYMNTHPLNISDGSPNCPFPLKWRYDKSEEFQGKSIYAAIRYLIPMAAFIVIGIFSARRESELMGLETDCIRQDESGYWLRAHIAKTYRCDKEIPTVRAVADAVKLLYEWGERGRLSGSKKLFTHWTPISSSPIQAVTTKDLNVFARIALGFEMTHKLQTRQFRRFFAVTYFWRYKLAKLPALSQFLCHFSISMTKEYVTEKVSNEIFVEVNGEFSREILINAATGEKPIGGQFSRVWNRKVQKIRAYIRENIEFVSEEGYQKVFLGMVEDSIRLITPTPGGACASRNLPKDVMRAKCSQVEMKTGVLMKMPELSTPSKCGSCPFSITDVDHMEYWSDALAQTRIASETGKGLLKSVAERDLVILNKFFKNNFSGEANEKDK
jgi:hypothetical protein